MMEPWQIRFREEYKQLHERYMKLKAYNNKKEVEAMLGIKTTSIDGEDGRLAYAKECYRRELMHSQQKVMGEYLHILELRAELEGISLD